MGGPILGFCGGRIDDPNGQDSLELGPTPIQESVYPCPVNGQCEPPFGTTTIGLIYVNPEGPMGVPNPNGSAPQIRSTFGQMGMNDSETVSLIGGGHAFGKTHGACPLGPGPSPEQSPLNPWPGLCGSGKGNDTFTSGFEGPWTTTPTTWSNSYFQSLVNFKFAPVISPGNHTQWESSEQPEGLMMLTSDIALTTDASYYAIVHEFANDIDALNAAFSASWYKMTTRDMGPVTRCTGPYVPPAQEFQNPLPAPSPVQPDWTAVRSAVTSVMYSNVSVIAPDAGVTGGYYGAQFVQLAYACAATFRQTDYIGGCNGARIRFEPEKSWPVNVGLSQVLEVLQPVKDQFGPNLTWADLIVFAGQVAIEDASGLTLPWCAGRTDALDGNASQYLRPLANYSTSFEEIKERGKISGLSVAEQVVLQARQRSEVLMGYAGYSGSYSSTPQILSNEYFEVLTRNWRNHTFIPYSGGAQHEYTGEPITGSAAVYMTPYDLNTLYAPNYQAVIQMYAANNTLFLQDFASAWIKLMTIDRFDGPTGNLCPQYGAAVAVAPSMAPNMAPVAPSNPQSNKPDSFVSQPGVIALIVVCAVLAVSLSVSLFLVFRRGANKDDYLLLK